MSLFLGAGVAAVHGRGGGRGDGGHVGTGGHRHVRLPVRGGAGTPRHPHHRQTLLLPGTGGARRPGGPLHPAGAHEPRPETRTRR